MSGVYSGPRYVQQWGDTVGDPDPTRPRSVPGTFSLTKEYYDYLQTLPPAQREAEFAQVSADVYSRHHERLYYHESPNPRYSHLYAYSLRRHRNTQYYR